MLRDIRRGGLAVAGALCLSMALVLGACGDSSGDFTEGGSGVLLVTPPIINYDLALVGESYTRTFTVDNTANEGDLIVESMTIEGPGADQFALTDFDGQAFTLTSDDAPRTFVLTYAPTRIGTHTANIRVKPTNSESATVVPIITLPIEPQIVINPEPVSFGQVGAGEVEPREVSVSNVGTAPLCITRMEITGSTAFSPKPGQGTRSELALPANPLRLEPSPGNAAGDAYVFEILYAPQVQKPDTGTLIVTYDLDCDLATTNDVRTREVELRANGVEPCVRVTPEETIDFGQATIGITNTRTVTIENCGTGNLVVEAVRLGDDTDDTLFGLVGGPGTLVDQLTNTGPTTIVRGQTREVTVTFSPVDETLSSGELHIISDAQNEPNIVLPITGTGSYNQCPLAQASARTINSGAPFENQIAAEPLDKLEFKGDTSTDPDGQAITRYQWAVLEAPPGFALNFQPAPSVPNPTIELVLVGSYVFELTVADELGLESCEPARVEVRVTSDRAFVAELTWDTPLDTTVGDNSGPDLDLHFLEPGGLWNDRGGSDCYFANCTTGQDWGVSGSTADDPYLNRDDVDGEGPEQIDIREPAWTTGGSAPYNEPYQMGVYYFVGDARFGTAYATIRLYFDRATEPSVVWPSEPDPDTEGRALETSGTGFGDLSGDFWLAGAIDWSSTGPTATEIDIVSSGFP